MNPPCGRSSHPELDELELLLDEELDEDDELELDELELDELELDELELLLDEIELLEELDTPLLDELDVAGDELLEPITDPGAAGLSVHPMTPPAVTSSAPPLNNSRNSRLPVGVSIGRPNFSSDRSPLAT